MSMAIKDESERVLVRMEELRDLSLEGVREKAREINHTLTPQDIRDVKNQVRDDFLLRVNQEFSTGLAKEFADLMRRSFELQILGSSLVEKEIQQFK